MGCVVFPADPCLLAREDFYRHFLADGLRPDGRGLRQQRSAELQRHALGDLVKLVKCQQMWCLPSGRLT